MGIVLGSNAHLFGDVRRTHLADCRFIDAGGTIHLGPELVVVWAASRQAVMCGVLLTDTATPCPGRIAATHAVWFAALERTLIPPTVATLAPAP